MGTGTAMAYQHKQRHPKARHELKLLGPFVPELTAAGARSIALHNPPGCNGAARSLPPVALPLAAGQQHQKIAALVDTLAYRLSSVGKIQFAAVIFYTDITCIASYTRAIVLICAAMSRQKKDCYPMPFRASC